MKRPAGLRYLPVGKFLSPPGAVDPSATRPNLHRVMVRSPIENRICLIDGIEERAGSDLLVGFDAVLYVEEVTAIEGHDLCPRLEKGSLSRPLEGKGQGRCKR